MLSLKTALERSGRCWWVAPNYAQSTVAWRELKGLANQVPGKVVREDERRITLPGGGEITVRSAETLLRGEGLDLVVIDEAAYIAPDVFYDALRPALSDRKGAALIISTPNGFDWFYDAYARGQEGRSDWQSWQLATTDNPLIDPAEVAAARETMPERSWRQEYLAEFTDAQGAVFRFVRDAATAEPQKQARPEHTYVIGVDWAGPGRGGDYTVFAVVDATTGALVHLDRFGGAEYAVQRGRLAAVWERFGRPVIIAEQNSMGGPVVEQLQREGLNVRPFVTTNATKAASIDALALAFEQSAIRILPDPVLIGELGAFIAEKLPSGLTRYAARVGHDDCVMALALAWSGAARPRSNSAVGAFL